MKKILYLIGVIGGVALALSAVGLVYAQTQTPPQPYYPGDGSGYMGGFGRGGSGMGMMSGLGSGTEGPIHDYMMTELAQALNLETSTELESRLEAGDTLWSIAQEQGFSYDEFRALVLQARTDALNAAVGDGVITQEQADWMLSHMNQGWDNGYGPGSGTCDGSGPSGMGFRGAGFRRQVQSNP
jgi:hypothetical protein